MSDLRTCSVLAGGGSLCVKDNIHAGSLLLLCSHSLSASTKGPSEDKTTVLLMHKQFFLFCLVSGKFVQDRDDDLGPIHTLKPQE